MHTSLLPTVSAIIPAFNAQQFVGRAIESLLATGYPKLQIVVVDDGSTDNTLECITHLAQARADSVIVVRQHPDGANRGVSASRNLGISTSSGELICFLDADDTVEPHRFENATRILSESPEVDGVYEMASVVVEHPTQATSWKDQQTFGIQDPLQHTELLKTLIQGTPWPSSGILFRRTLLDQTGCFHESFSIAEDCHLWMRMAAVGHVVPGNLEHHVSTYHRQTGSLYTPSIDRKLDYFRALADFLRWTKHAALPATTKDVIRQEIGSWLDNTLIQCREQSRGRLALAVVGTAARSMPGLAFTRRNLANVLFTIMRK